jgi:hypothetical protein
LWFLTGKVGGELKGLEETKKKTKKKKKKKKKRLASLHGGAETRREDGVVGLDGRRG